MCAASNSTNILNSSTNPTNQKLGFKNSKNKHSHGRKQNFTPKQSGSAQKPSGESRNAKRARWAKKARPAAKPIAKRGPVKSYTSLCCTMPAIKPRCGAKEAVKDAESGKIKDKAKGLGHWRCSACQKVCKVRPGPANIEDKVTGESKCPQTLQPMDKPQAEE